MCTAMIPALTVIIEQRIVTKATAVSTDVHFDYSVELYSTISVMHSHVRVFIVIYRVASKSMADIHSRQSHTFNNRLLYNAH